MAKYKYIPSMGLAFAEEQEMKQLGAYARKGWLFKKFSLFGYILMKGEPQDLQYALDYRKKPDEEYFSYFAEAGWTHVTAVGKEIHIFSAPAGVTPIYTDRTTTIEKYKQEQRKMGLSGLLFLAITVLFFGLMGLGLPQAADWLLYTAGVLSAVCLVFTGLPFLGYSYKLRKLRN